MRQKKKGKEKSGDRVPFRRSSIYIGHLQEGGV